MPLIRMGFVMLIVHGFTVLCVSQLPETKGSHLGVAVEAAEHDRPQRVNNDDEDCEEEQGEVEDSQDNENLLV